MLESQIEKYNLKRLLIGKKTLEFNINSDGEVVLVNAENEEGELTIPNFVSIIGKSAFKGSKIKSVNIPGTVKVIEDSAFEGCNQLEDVNICDGVRRIGDNAFRLTWIKRLTIPGTVEYLGKGLCGSCYHLETVTLKDGIKYIPKFAFNRCFLLKHIEIPDTVTEIHDLAFYRCEMLTDVKLPKCLNTIGELSFNYCLKMDKLDIPDNVKIIPSLEDDKKNVLNYSKVIEMINSINAKRNLLGRPRLDIIIKDEDVILQTLPKDEEFFDIPPFVTIIGSRVARNYRHLVGVRIPNSVKEIREEAFYGCDLRELEIPDSVVHIGSFAFAHNTKLKEVKMPNNNCISLRSGVFYNCPFNKSE